MVQFIFSKTRFEPGWVEPGSDEKIHSVDECECVWAFCPIVIIKWKQWIQASHRSHWTWPKYFTTECLLRSGRDNEMLWHVCLLVLSKTDVYHNVSVNTGQVKNEKGWNDQPTSKMSFVPSYRIKLHWNVSTVQLLSWVEFSSVDMLVVINIMLY